jgi:Intracellular proteinase inhibitor
VGRLVALVVILVALAPAASASQTDTTPIADCGTRDNPAVRPVRAARPRDLDFGVRYSTDGTRVRWVLSLRNRTRRTVGIAFPTSQYADVLVRKGGRVEHWWGWRRAFFQAFTHRILRPRETYVCALQPARLDLEPGRYELHAYLTSTIRVELRRALLVNG